MKKVLILGSSGQIGGALSIYANAIGLSVVPFDIENSPSQDLRLPKSIDLILPTVDFVFFLAFDVGGSTYLKRYQDTTTFLDNNMSIMLNTFTSLRKFNTPFIFASSQMANMSYSNYGLLKSIGERYTNLLGGILVKFWNVYGIERDEKKFHVITDFIRAAKNHGHIKIKTSGKEMRQFLHTDDCCNALLTLARQYHSLPRNANYHVSSFSWNSIEEIATIICSISGASYSLGLESDIQQDKKNEPDTSILSLWRPRIDINTGIRMVYQNI